MNSLDVAYLAGIIDGEGYIGVSREGSLRVVVTGTNIDLMRWIQGHVGLGTVRTHYRRDGIRKPAHYWRVFGPEAWQVLRHVRRHLIIKAGVADLAVIVMQTTDALKRREISERVKGLNSAKGRQTLDSRRAKANGN